MQVFRRVWRSLKDWPSARGCRRPQWGLITEVQSRRVAPGRLSSFRRKGAKKTLDREGPRWEGGGVPVVGADGGLESREESADGLLEAAADPRRGSRICWHGGFPGPR